MSLCRCVVSCCLALPQCKEVKRLAFGLRVLHHVAHARRARIERFSPLVPYQAARRRGFPPAGFPLASVAVNLAEQNLRGFSSVVKSGDRAGIVQQGGASPSATAPLSKDMKRRRGLSYIWPSCYVMGAGTSSISLRHLTVRGDKCCYLAWERVWKTFARKHLLATGGCPVPSARSAYNFCYGKRP